MINKADPQAAFILDVNDKVKKEIDKINQQISYTDLIILIDLNNEHAVNKSVFPLFLNCLYN